MNCHYCKKPLGNTDPQVYPNEHPTRRQCAECAVEMKYIHARGQRTLATLLTKVVRSSETSPETKTVIKLTAKAIGWMDQGMGHGHYGWRPLSQEEFGELHDALAKLGALEGE